MNANCAKTVAACNEGVKIAAIRDRIASGCVVIGTQPEASEP
jgi:hypothetical protein